MKLHTEHWAGKIFGMSGLMICLLVGIPGVSQGDVSVEISVDSDNASLVYDEGEAPGEDYVRVEASFVGEDIATPAFWRLRYRSGYTWVDGEWDEDVYVPGHWRPERIRRGNWAWVPGHWVGRHWIVGRWRPATRVGYVWVEGRWTRDGDWVEGYWYPTAKPPRGRVWEPGYWGSRGNWVEGYWRPLSRSGYVWAGGEFNNRGIWIKGRWLRGGPEVVWVRSYWDHSGHWHAGQVVERPRQNERYIPPHYNHRGEWVEPRWADERAQQREHEQQLRGYREDREGSQPDRHEKGGEVRKIGGPRYDDDRDDDETRPDPRRREEHGYQKEEPGQHTKIGEYEEQPKSYKKQRYQEDADDDYDDRKQPRVKAEPPSRPGKPGAMEETKSNPEQHQGWDKGVGNKHGEEGKQNPGQGNQGQEKQKDKGKSKADYKEQKSNYKNAR